MKHKIRLLGENNKEFLSSTDMWDKLKDLPDPDVLESLMDGFERFRNFLYPLLRKTVKERILSCLEFNACHYATFETNYSEFIGPHSLKMVVTELLIEKKIEYFNGWYRLPKEVILKKPM